MKVHLKEGECNSNCSNNLEWDFQVSLINPQDFFRGNTETGLITVTKNTNAPLIVSVRARNIGGCATPSDWSNSIGRYYGTISGGNLKQNSLETNEQSNNAEFPFTYFYDNSTDALTIRKLNLKDWMNYKYSGRNLNKEEVDMATSIILNEGEFENLKLNIYNFEGRQVLEENIKNEFSSYNLNKFRSGIYILKFKFGHIEYVKKIYLNKL